MQPRFVLIYDEGFWEDLKNSVDWYDQASAAIGTKFLEAVWLSELKIQTNPFAFRKISKTNYRRILLKKFSHKIFYTIEGNKIFIIALIHSSRSNRFIKKRLS